MVAKAIQRVRAKVGRPEIDKPRKRRTRFEMKRARNQEDQYTMDTIQTKRLLNLCGGGGSGTGKGSKKKKGLELFAMSDYITVGRIEAVLNNIRTSPYGLVVHEFLIKTFGNIEMSVVVSYLLYMEHHLIDKESKHSEQWFVVIYEQLKKYTGLKHNRVCNTIKELRDVGLVETKMEGMPARQHFRLDNEFLMSLIFEANPPRGFKGRNIDKELGICDPDSDKPLFKNQKRSSGDK